MHFLEFLTVPTILFLVVVMPIWLVLDYRHKGRARQGLSEDDQVKLDELLRTLDKVVDRVDALEGILDERSPRWKRDR